MRDIMRGNVRKIVLGVLVSVALGVTAQPAMTVGAVAARASLTVPIAVMDGPGWCC
jgi:hypothetical protein